MPLLWLAYIIIISCFPYNVIAAIEDVSLFILGAEHNPWVRSRAPDYSQGATRDGLNTAEVADLDFPSILPQV